MTRIVPMAHRADGRVTSDWNATDFLLHGEYCELETIGAALEDLRRGSGARLALLIAYRSDVLFQSLLLIADEDADRGRKSQERLLAGQPWRPLKNDPFGGLADGHIEAADFVATLSAQEPFSRIEDQLGGEVAVLSRASPRASPSSAAPAPAAVHVLLCDPRSLADEFSEADIDRLLLMVNGSAAVVVHGALETERAVEANLDSVSPDLPSRASQTTTADTAVKALSAFAQALLPSALTLTDSEEGRVYLARRDGTHLELVAREPERGQEHVISADDRETEIAWVYRRRRPLVINNVPDSLRINTSGRAADGRTILRGHNRQLAVPIVQHSLAGARTVLGVISVSRRATAAAGSYSYRDVTALRTIAHRIALWRGNAMVDETSTALARLMKRTVTGATLALEADRSSASSSEPRRKPPELTTSIPADVHAASEIIDQILQSVYGLTRSNVATVSLLSPDRSVLTRFAAYPRDQAGHEWGTIPVNKRDSVVAWVARNGKHCYLSNLRDPQVRRQYPDLEGWLDVGIHPSSEICAPIFVGGRLVGTLDLESRFVDGYADSEGIAIVAAELVGLAIQQARRFHEQAVLSMSTATTANVHELGKLSERLELIATDRAAEAVASELREVAQKIVECSRSGAEVSDGEWSTTAEAVGDVLRELELAPYFVVKGKPQQDRHFAGADLLALRSALAALFDNAYRQCDGDNRRLAVAWRNVAIGGRHYLTLLIMNTVRWAPEEARLAELFRYSILPEGSSRFRLGGFTAGALVRSLGGDVFVVRSEAPWFIVGVDLPLDAPALSGEVPS